MIKGLPDARLKQQLDFVLEIDKLKTIVRQTILTDRSRRETDAEHSWHFAMMALVLKEYAEGEVDIGRVVKMALIHDLVEIDAGDTFAFDVKANLDREEREKKAADRVFAILPPDQRDEYRALWDEFEQAETSDARYAAAIDRLQPFLHNCMTDGHTWVQGDVDRAQVLKRIGMLEHSMPRLWGFVLRQIDEGVLKGYIRP